MPKMYMYMLQYFTLYGHFLVTWLSNFNSNDRFGLLSSCKCFFVKNNCQNCCTLWWFFPFLIFFTNFYLKNGKRYRKTDNRLIRTHKTRNPYNKSQCKILKYSRENAKNVFLFYMGIGMSRERLISVLTTDNGLLLLHRSFKKKFWQNQSTLKIFNFLHYMGIFWSRDCPISILMTNLDSSHYVDD